MNIDSKPFLEFSESMFATLLKMLQIETPSGFAYMLFATPILNEYCLQPLLSLQTLLRTYIYYLQPLLSLHKHCLQKDQ